MPFTPEQEAKILHHVQSEPENQKKKFAQDPQLLFKAIGAYLGLSVTDYILKQHGWPAIQRKLQELIHKWRL